MATSAVHKFFAESKKRVNKGILGGLIQILDFEVVATHLGPRDSRLTLLINEFKSLGSEGSSIFGGSRLPRPIEVNQEIQKLSGRLKEIRAKEYTENRHHKHLHDSEGDSTVTSHNDFDLSSDDGPLASQQALATQAQRTNHPIEKEHGSPILQDSVPLPAHVASVKSSSPVQKQPNTPLDMKTGNSDTTKNEKAISEMQAVRHSLEKSSGGTTNEVKKPKNVASLLSLIHPLLPKGNLIKSMAHPKLMNKNEVTAEKSVPERENLKNQDDVAEPPNMVGQSNGSSIAVEPEALVKEKESVPEAERNTIDLANGNHNSIGTIGAIEESATVENADPALAQVSSLSQILHSSMA